MKLRRFILICFLCLITIILSSLIPFCLIFKEKTKSLKEFTAIEKERITAAWDISLSSKDDIIAFYYISSYKSPFFVLQLKTTDFDFFCKYNENICKDTYKTEKDFSHLYRNDYLPRSEYTVFYSDKYIYISTYDEDKHYISNIFYELDNQKK